MNRRVLNTGGRWVKFNLVGGLGVAVQLGVLLVLNGFFGLNYLVATALGVEAAIVHNFVWHERFTWAERNSREWRSRLLRFLRFSATTGAVSIAGNLLLMRLLAGQAHVPALPANLMSIAACSLLNFAVSDRWVFAPAHGRQSARGRSSAPEALLKPAR